MSVYSHATVLNSKFDNNCACDNSAGSGFSAGVVSVDVDSTFIAENCTFSNNIGGMGGAIGVINGSKVVSQ